MKTLISKYIPSFVGIAILLAVFVFAAAFSNPSQNPPSGNISVPLNTSSTAQTKSGDLTVNNLNAANVNAANLSASSTLSVNTVSASGNITGNNVTANSLLTALGNLVVNGAANISSWSHSNTVTKLNSDKVDSYHAADLLAQSGGGGILTTWGYASGQGLPPAGQNAPVCPSGWTEVYAGYGPFYYYEKASNGSVMTSATNGTCSINPTQAAGVFQASNGYSYAVYANACSATSFGGTFCNTCRVCVK